MRNVILRGGRPVGPPAGWNAEENGECLTLSVLFSAPNYPDMHTVTTAWTFDDAELHALHQGGAFFLSATLPFVPLQRLWTQDAAGQVVGELVMSEHGVQPVEPGSDALALRRAIETAAALRAAIIAVGRALARKVGGDTSDQFWLGADNAGIVQQLADLVARVSARSSIVGIPLLTLDDIAAGNVGKGRPFPGEPVDPATQSELERKLGVHLNQDLAAAAEAETTKEPATEAPGRDWLKIARAAGEHGVRYRTNRALSLFLDAVTDQPPPALDPVEQNADAVVENKDGRFVARFANPLMADMFVADGNGHYRRREAPTRG